jgi:hypothetical protein
VVIDLCVSSQASGLHSIKSNFAMAVWTETRSLDAEVGNPCEVVIEEHLAQVEGAGVIDR